VGLEVLNSLYNTSGKVSPQHWTFSTLTVSLIYKS